MSRAPFICCKPFTVHRYVYRTGFLLFVKRNPVLKSHSYTFKAFMVRVSRAAFLLCHVSRSLQPFIMLVFSCSICQGAEYKEFLYYNLVLFYRGSHGIFNNELSAVHLHCTTTYGIFFSCNNKEGSDNCKRRPFQSL